MKVRNIFIILIHNLLAIFVNYCQNQTNEGICVMRGICGEFPEFGDIACTNKSEPIVLKEVPENIRSLSLLEAMCPHIHEKGDPLVCCDEFQLESMFITVYNLAHMGFNHCPSCLKNLEKLFCEMNCSPKQKEFIKVKKIKKTDSGSHLVTDIDYYLSEEYANRIFDSCKNVRNFEGIIMDSICSGFKGANCTVSKWLNHLGTSIEEEGISAFQIDFHIRSETTIKIEKDLFKPLNEKTFKCSEKPTKELNACDCHHCPESCPHTKQKRDLNIIREKRDNGMCLMKGICGETAFGIIPCVANEAPSPISDPIALEELKEMCPHLATSDNPSVCCTEEQIIRLNETFEMVSMFLKECPSCVRNLEKVFCHLSCDTNQHKFMKILKSEPNDIGKQMVSEVQYYINEDWAKGVYDSCKGVHRLGFNVLNHYCKPYKARDCDHKKFLQCVGGDHDHFGHSPFEINFVFTKEESLESDGIHYNAVKQPFYKCSENPHTGEGICPCIHCQDSCAPGEQRIIEKKLPKYNKKDKRHINSKIKYRKVN